MQNFNLYTQIAPFLSQCSTVSFEKKESTFLMTNQDMWSVPRTEGNLTQITKDVIDLLKAVKISKEVRD